MPSNKLFARYPLYEQAFQAPEYHVRNYMRIFKEVFKKPLRSLREDFAGTFWFSTEWVRSAPDRSAIAVEIDPVPIEYGRQTHLATLDAEQQKRLKILERDVRVVTNPKVQVVSAGNVSCFLLTKREELKDYFRAAYRSLTDDGLMILEVEGGPASAIILQDREHFLKDNKPWFTSVWDQQDFDPITNVGRFAVHFEFPDGKVMKNAFVYQARIWTIADLKELAEEVGFSDVYVYWEHCIDGVWMGDYMRIDIAPPVDEGWSCYVVAVKGKSRIKKSKRPIKYRIPARYKK